MLTPAAQDYLTEIGRQQGWGESWAEIEPRAVAELAPSDVGRVGILREYADVVAFLAGPSAAYLTGATLNVDGGWYDPGVRSA